MTIETIKKETELQMQTCLEHLVTRFGRMRTGRASPELLSNINVDYYGTETPLPQLANVTVEGSKTLVVTCWDKGSVEACGKAIACSDLGINPNIAGQVIRIHLPPLTEERRKDLARIVQEEGEQACVQIRQVRRQANQTLKALLKLKEIAEDEERHAGRVVQDLTDVFIEKINQRVADKIQEVTTI